MKNKKILASFTAMTTLLSSFSLPTGVFAETPVYTHTHTGRRRGGC